MRVVRLILALILAAALFALFCFLEARRDPIVRRATIGLSRWPAGARPIRAVLISDIHIGTAAMGPARLERIVGQINALHPDVVLIAGDFIFGNDPNGAAKLGEPMVAPLSRLRAPLGTIAVLGNHDWWTGRDVVRAQLARARVRVLENEAIEVGPLALGGISDDYTRHADLDKTLPAIRALPGTHVLLTHSPDIAPDLPADMPLLLAGHTHCGQVVLPFYGPISDVSRYRKRYRCGLVRERMHLTVVTAGLGTSGGPFRFNAPPDLWLLTLAPIRSRAAPAAAAAAR